ncbi:MAG: protein kinase [Planctomycetota bacterium]|nr:protein kinase [Planctomycetota bacterium]
MDAKRWSELQALFLDAIELPAKDREAFVRERAGDDEWLLRELLRMLDAHESASGFFDPPKPDDLAARISPPDYLRGTILGDFELKEEIGRGGMGIVYRALQRSLEREVAVKVLPPALAVSSLRLERFRREALAASRLAHPGLVPVLAFGSEDGIVYYAMELVEGPCLKDVLRGEAKGAGPEPGNARQVAAFVAQLLGALHQVHEAGLVHRDVKPDNILVAGSGPMLIDFGLAKDLAMSGLTGTGEAAGSLHYMSPEQVRAKRDGIDRRSDIYSAGAVLYELLTGQRPFPGSEPAELFARITSEQPIAPRRLVKDLPRDLELIVMQALEKDRGDRYGTAEQMAKDLGRFLDGQPVLAKPPSLAKRTERVLVKRRTVLMAGAAAVGAGLMGRYSFPAAASGNAGAVLLDLGSLGGQGSFQLEAHHYLDVWGAASEVRVTDEITGGASLELSLQPGLWRLDLRGPSATRAEFLAVVSANTSEAIRAFAAPSQPDPELVGPLRTVPGGEVRCNFHMVGVGDDVNRDVVVRDFELTATTITRGQLRAGLSAIGEWPPSYWSQEQATAWEALGGEDLPATKIRRSTMRLFAASQGLRLPTAAEWARAMTPTHELWLEGGGPTASNLVQGDSPADTDGNPDRPFAQGVRPSLEPGGGWGPFGLHHPFGNVEELVEVRIAMRPSADGNKLAGHDEDGAMLADQFVGLFWDDGVALADGALINSTAYTLNDGQSTCGFRCARSLP